MAEFLVGGVLLILFNVYPPFGMENVAKQQASAVLQRALSPFYNEWSGRGFKAVAGVDDPKNTGDANPDKITRGQRSITVVTIDEAYFRQARIGGSDRPIWPLPITSLVRGIIGKVVHAQPKAVFVDIAFPVAPREIVAGRPATPDQGAEALANGLLALKPTMPVLIGETLAPPEDAQDMSCGSVPYLDEEQLSAFRITMPALRERLASPVADHMPAASPTASQVSFVNLSWQGIDPTGYPLSAYQLGPLHSCEEHRGKGYLPSPALQLFKIFMANCPSHPAISSPCADRRVHDLDAAIRVEKNEPGDLALYGATGAPVPADKVFSPLSVQWGINLSPAMRRQVTENPGGNDCFRQFSPGPLDTVRIYFDNLFGQAGGGVDNQRCVFIDNISAADLLRAADPQTTARVAALLKDRIVMIGVAIPQARDIFPSPVNGELPGVFMHAVALENLLSWGSDFHWQRPNTNWPPQLAIWGPQFLALIFAIALRFALIAVAESRISLPCGPWRTPARISFGLFRYAMVPILTLLVVTPLAARALSYSDLPSSEMAGPIILFHLVFVEVAIESFETLAKKTIEHFFPVPS